MMEMLYLLGPASFVWLCIHTVYV